jgi:thiol-disulfide isomerase/thioredoxin
MARVLIRVLCLLAALALFALDLSGADPPARVIGGAGSFVKVEGGWRCTAAQPKFVPPVLRELRAEDILVRIDDMDLSSPNPLLLAEVVRRAELGIVNHAVVLRRGERITLVAPQAVPNEKSPEIVVAQNGSEVLRSTLPGLSVGARIERIGGKSWEAIESTFKANTQTPFININFNAPTTVSVVGSGAPVEITAENGLTLTGMHLPEHISRGGEVEFPASIVLRGLNVSDTTLRSARGRWLLVHFWASWCRPCVLEAPAIAELTHRKDLTVVAVGYADTEERMRDFAANVSGFPVYAPDAVLTSEMAVNGVPFDVLVNPEGRAVAVLSGTLPEGMVGVLVEHYAGSPGVSH